MTVRAVTAQGYKIKRLTRDLWLVEKHGAYLGAGRTLPEVLAVLLMLATLDSLTGEL